MTALNPLIEQYELIKEIHYIFENIEPKIKGRVYKIVLGNDAKYIWEVNYYNRLSGELDAYVPSAPFGDSLNETENKLNQYIKRFENAEDWRSNDFF